MARSPGGGGSQGSDEVDEFQSEKEQIEEIKKWWKENGTFVITGLLLGVLVLGGMRYWKEYRLARAESASLIYEQLMDAVSGGDPTGAAAIATRLKGEYSGTPYAAHAAMALAALHVNDGEPEQAAAELRFALETTDDEQLANVARLRLARVLIFQNKAGEAIEILGAARSAEFAARYHDVRGDAYAELGQVEQARREYQAALDKGASGLVDREFIEMKLNDLVMSEPGA